ncbi:MAG: hypothetical protein JNG90_02875, partial [Planctomycetaceae bacterium]|nr:hypothetical protein [Planctomycetaceae bacterium]
RDATPAHLKASTWYGVFSSTAPLQLNIPLWEPEPVEKPAIYARGSERRIGASQGTVARAQFAEAIPGGAPAGPPAGLTPGTRRIRYLPRSSAPVQITSYPDPETNMQTIVIDSGVVLIVDGIEGVGPIDLQADRMVIWTANLPQGQLTPEAFQPDNTPLEVYLEGNIEVREGDRQITAERMYYDLQNQVGTVIDAEILTPVTIGDALTRSRVGMVRLRSSVLRQLGKDRFVAQDTFLTTSRLGQPAYRVQTSEAYFEDIQRPLMDPVTGAQQLDSQTGEPLVEHQRLATSRNNVGYLGNVPVFYWPTLATDLTEPTFFIDGVTIRSDRNVFGTQILTKLDAYELLGIENAPAGTAWKIRADYLSLRGPAVGTSFQYDRTGEFFGTPSRYAGLLDAWSVYDTGLDNLGRTRQDIIPDKTYRWRILDRHRQMLPYDIRLSTEVGWISDYNFLEQYYEKEYDEFKDQSTGFELLKVVDNQSFSLTGDARLNNFFTETQWLPRADHFWLGQSLLGDYVTWYAHTNVGFAQLRVQNAPTDPQDLQNFTFLPWEQVGNGERVATRHEIDLPLNLGVFKVVPYGLGELAHWGADLNKQALNRAYGQVGVRASLPMWTANSEMESTLLNVHGIAHKIVFDVDAYVAQATQDLSQLQLYDNIDDNAIERFRSRFATLDFGGVTPMQFDERYYAIRTGLASNVTGPTEIAQDLMAVRFGARQRWQTKRGLPGQRRIQDWVMLDTRAVYYPDASRDNFGATFGLLQYDFRWQAGDRTSVISDGTFDFFDQGQKIWTVGGFITRPPRGNIYAGFRWFEGPFTSQVVSTSYNYWMSPKWISSFGTSFDISGNGNIGQFLSITRIGESFLTSLGFNIDASKGNFGLTFAIEPRFLPRSQIFGGQIPPTGAFGLE